MSYLASYSDWLGETRYERIETPDEDYDRMKQMEMEEQMEKPSIVDIRVMANKAAQKILERNSVHAVVVPKLCNGTVDEHQLTGIIAEALSEYFGLEARR